MSCEAGGGRWAQHWGAHLHPGVDSQPLSPGGPLPFELFLLLKEEDNS